MFIRTIPVISATVGAIYTRFADKDTLLMHLIVELQKNQMDAAVTMFDPDCWQDIPLARSL